MPRRPVPGDTAPSTRAPEPADTTTSGAAPELAGTTAGEEPEPAATAPPATTTGPVTPRTEALARSRRVPYTSGALPAAAVTGLVAAATVPVDRPGIGWLLAGSAAAGAVVVVRRRAPRPPGPEGKRPPGPARSRERWFWSSAALALLAVGTFRAAGWLFALCVAAAVVAGSLAVADRRAGRGILRDAVAVPLASFGGIAWAYAAQSDRPPGAGARARRLGVSTAVTAGLLAVFVPLLSGADATFAALVEGLVPRIDGDRAVRWIVLFLAATAGCLGALQLLARPRADGVRPPAPGRTLARLEWGLPVGALTAVFAVFVGAQLVALFGGDDYVQRTAGLTYAEYARGGFWQLSAVTVLTLAVILPVLHRAGRESAGDRRWLRILLCAISGLTLVMIASALGRMWTYQQAYGFTVLRLLVGTCELWLGLVYILVVVAVLRLEAGWLPRTAIGTAVAALLLLSVLNPEALVASANIDRWHRGAELDLGYLGGLSADIVPATDRLPDALRGDLRARLGAGTEDDTWNSWNLARTRAR